jgi:hypothetical protein
MSYRAFAVLLAVCLCACSGGRLAVETRAVAQRLNDDPRRYIVGCVDNYDATLAGHAGSSPRGYDAMIVYGPTSRARQLLMDLEHDYGLREITAWSIAPLHMHCAVLEVPASADRASVLAALTQDRRVRIAQPLQTFHNR